MFDKYAGVFLHIMTNRFAARIAHSVLFFDKYTNCIFLCFISNYNKSLPGNHPDRDLKEKRSFLCSWFPCLRFGAAGVPHTRLHSRPGFLFTLLW